MKTRTINLVRKVLWIDCSAGFAAVIAMLLLREWLGSFYEMPSFMFFFMGLANLASANISVEKILSAYPATSGGLQIRATSRGCGIGSYVDSTSPVKWTFALHRIRHFFNCSRSRLHEHNLVVPKSEIEATSRRSKLEYLINLVVDY